MEELAIEVARLRAQLRRQRIALLVVAGCAATGTLATLRAAGAPAVVEAQRFRLLDAAGNERANLMMLDDTAALGLYDSAGKVRVLLMAGEQTAVHVSSTTQRLLLSPGMLVVESNGASAVRLGGVDAQLAFVGADGKPAAILDKRALTFLPK